MEMLASAVVMKEDGCDVQRWERKKNELADEGGGQAG